LELNPPNLKIDFSEGKELRDKGERKGKPNGHRILSELLHLMVGFLWKFSYRGERTTKEELLEENRKRGGASGKGGKAHVRAPGNL